MEVVSRKHKEAGLSLTISMESGGFASEVSRGLLVGKGLDGMPFVVEDVKRITLNVEPGLHVMIRPRRRIVSRMTLVCPKKSS